MNNFYGYNPQMNLNRIDKQIEDLQNLKNQMQVPQQQAPINNYINTGIPKIDMEAKFLGEGQSISDIIVQNKTLFIDEANKKISIKELDGTISKEYEIVVPKTKEQLRIEELETTNKTLQNRLNDMEGIINELTKSNRSNKQGKQSNDCNDGYDVTSAKANNEQSKRTE